MFPLLLSLSALAQSPTRYASLSTLLYIPNTIAWTIERPRSSAVTISGSVLTSYMPDMYFFGGFAFAGVGGALHILPGDLGLEIALGLDLGAAVDVDGEGVSPFLAPSLFVGRRWEPTQSRQRLVRLGTELSGHSVLGLTVSVGPR